MEQFDQLLTCCICLDRYRTPKLLPCQHSYCLDPCMEGLVDYVKRQVKCPECRAEHRIPYNGIQGFPTNYTLQKFLELHADITGELPDPNADAVMSRCTVCNEKAYVNDCGHCDKKVCDTCKDAHCDILKREITRVNNQIKRGLHRIEDALGQVERNQQQLQTNKVAVVTEIDEIHRRLSNALKERTDYLKSSVDKYVVSEEKNLKELKDNLDLEITNISSNADLMEKNLDDGTKWDDVELMDCKDIFIKMMDWIRNYDTSSEEFTRKIRFTSHDGVNDLAKRILEIGDLKMQENKPAESETFESRSSGLSRSKSDHRLVTEFRRQEENTSPTVRRRAFGDRAVYGLDKSKSRSNIGGRYGGEEEEEDSSSRSSRFRSRFLRGEEEEGSDRRNSRNIEDEETKTTKKERNKVIETEDASRGPLSGCIRLADSSRVIQRLKEHEMELIRPKKKDTPPPAPKPKSAVPPPTMRPAPKQDDDEIDRIKQENKAKEAATASVSTTTAVASTPSSVTTSTVTSTPTPTTTTPATVAPVPARRTSVTQQPTPPAPVRPTRSSVSSVPPPVETRVTSPPRVGSTQQTATTSVAGSKFTSRSGSPSSIVNRYATTSSQPVATGAKSSGYGAGYSSGYGATAQDASPDSDFSSSDSSSSDSDSDDDDDIPAVEVVDDGYEYEYYDDDEETPALAPVTKTPAGPSSILKKSTPTSSSYGSSSATSYGASTQEPSPSYGGYSSSYGTTSSAHPEPPARNQSAYGASSSSGYGASRAEPEPVGRSQKSYGGARTTSAYSGSWGQTEPETVPLSPSSARRSSRYAASPEPSPARSSVLSERRFSREESSDSGAGGYGTRLKKRDDSDSFVSRYLAKSRPSSGGLSQEDADQTPEDSVAATKKIAGELQYPSGRSRYAALKERKARLAKSKSSAMIGLGGNDDGDDDDGEEMLTPFTSRFGGELARSRSSHMLKDQPTSSSRGHLAEPSPGPMNEQDENLSSWAKYLKTKYGGRGTATGGSGGQSGPNREAEKEERRARLGLGQANNEYEQSKNATGSPAPTPQQPSVQGVSGGIGSMSKNQYLQKQALVLKFGARGSQPGFFTWPRGIAVGPDNNVVVADSSNHRVQIFDEQGQNRFWLGGYGNGEGEFDCLAGVAVNRIGQFIIADRYNHRIQIFDPSGHFLRTFGSQGTEDGKFNYPWGICTDALGFIFVCDKENHRIQVFQSDGTFVGKFGSMGSKPGQLEHPHYIAVSNTNRVIVSDSNNHRLQIFDVNGKVLTTFGSEGTDEGQFKFPRGVAVDEGGFIFVADSGNNRIQIFNPDGTFLRAFGRWGQNDGEFKGLEGIAVNNKGNILVADRENHRIQIF